MAGHTPGPWELAPYSDSDEIINVVRDYKLIPNGSQAVWIAELDLQLDYDSDLDAQFEELEANAHLIAAAPELLDALKSLMELREAHFSPDDYAWESRVKDAYAAIAKAEGRA